MIKYKLPLYLVLSAAFIFMSGCAVGNEQVLASNESQVKLRSIQSRVFDTSDKLKTLRAVIATLQDLGFVVDKADDVLGSVSATKLRGYQLRMTVTVKPRGHTQVLVRANATYNVYPVEEPKPYQTFFDALSNSLFLQAHNVD
jgi:hypothetical protein